MYKIMGLDVGTKRIGIALSDFLLITAQPCETINREPEEKSVEKIVQLCAQNCVKKIVIGLPKNMNGTVGSQAQDCENFANLLKLSHMGFVNFFQQNPKIHEQNQLYHIQFQIYHLLIL